MTGTDDLDHVLMARTRNRDMAAYRTLVHRNLPVLWRLRSLSWEYRRVTPAVLS